MEHLNAVRTQGRTLGAIERKIMNRPKRVRRRYDIFASLFGLCGGVLFVCVLTFGTLACAQESASDAAALTRFDALSQKGWNIPHPSVADTIVGDAGGVRSTLADAGVGFYGFLGPNLFLYDLTQANAGKPRVLNGQVGTWSQVYASLAVSYDLKKIGLDGGQLTIIPIAAVNGLQLVNGPDYIRIRDLSYYQSLAGGKISFEAGFYANDIRFIGNFVGGSLAAGTLGPQAFIPYEAGISRAGFSAAATDVRIDLGGGFYDRAGVQRGLVAGNGILERQINPNPGLRFAPRNTGVLFINEFGFQKTPSASQASVWFRAGGIYNTTDYPAFTSGRGMHNWALYALADHQLTSTDRAQPFHGLYVGASVMYAPPLQNLFSQYYELRAYQFGPFSARPEDFASVVASYETYSKEGGEVLSPPAIGAFSNTTSIIGTYAFHVRPGVYVQPGLGYITHPSVSRAFNNEFNCYLNLNFFL